jgi:hypothetical protein
MLPIPAELRTQIQATIQEADPETVKAVLELVGITNAPTVDVLIAAAHKHPALPELIDDEAVKMNADGKKTDLKGLLNKALTFLSDAGKVADGLNQVVTPTTVPTDPQPQPQPTQVEAKQGRNWLLIGGCIVVTLAVILWYLKSRKK